MTPPFHLVETPVEPGITLIEASAGTGKTFTIAGIFVRLIIENRATVREILVVTFTEAATAELRGRIRQMLADALAAFATGTSEDPFLAALLAQHPGSAAGVQRRLDAALRGFDEAPIYTIHGFCQRTLKDRAFESGALFDTELIPDQSELLREITDDYWRNHFYSAEPALLGSALEGNLGPDQLFNVLEAAVRHPELHFISTAAGLPLREAQTALLAAFDAARQLWRAEEKTIRLYFGDGQTWGNHPYNSTVEMEAHFAGLDLCFNGSGAADVFKSFRVFSAPELAAGLSKRRKGNQPPPHAFFEGCERLLCAQQNYRLALLHDFVSHARAELPTRKQDRKLQSYDDLLTRLRDALRGEGAAPLTAQLHARYQAALIDEFQDTDPVQSEIFHRVFGTPSSLLFYIGDPKQAIYGFRGADVFTYLTARKQTARRYTLVHNWRSETGLVRGVNTLFQQSRQPFVFSGIDFEPVEARGQSDETPLLIDGQRPASLQFWFWPREGDRKSVSVARMEEQLPDIVAAEIAKLLAGKAVLGDQPVRAQDIAVLVMKHRQAGLIREALQRLNIPSVLHTEASVFDSAEARELRRVLAALAEPGRERLLRAALASDLCGVDGPALNQLSTDEVTWQNTLERFSAYHQQWLERGFMIMFRDWLQGEDVRQRLLAYGDGERRLTNLLHLGELLHRAELERHLAPAGLVRWLADQIHTDERQGEEHQLRLERDDSAVRLITIHKSKGLEFPIVFCPFAWRRSDVDSRAARNTYEEEVCFHQGEPPRLFVRDLGSADFEANKTRALAENLAENVRLLYVALTRARHRCSVVWGAFNQAESSALAWLLHQPPEATEISPTQLAEHFRGLTDAQLRADLNRLVRGSHDASGRPAIEVIDLPSAGAERLTPAPAPLDQLRPRPFTAIIRRDWRITSFSGLATGRNAEPPDYDAIPTTAPAPAEPAQDIFAFPVGTKAGTCLHEIFEELDFTSPDRSARLDLVVEKLRVHGYSATDWREVVTGAVERALHVPLEIGRPDFTLSRVPPTARLNELEFYFPITELSTEMLRETFAKETPAGEFLEDWPRRLDFTPANGYVKGYIDLAFQFEGRFYLVDWKSNWLGDRIEDYHAAALRRAMNLEFYALQYLLYTIALHRHLQLRLPNYDYERHFGGVRYLFLRGIDPARPHFGVFSARPARALIERLSQQFQGALMA
jgi:exodeoxyribonuclease V beta subunit